MPRSRTGLVLSTALFAISSACSMNSDDVGSYSADQHRECFHASQVSGFNGATNNQIYVDTGPSEVWLFDTFGNCPNLDFTQKLALKSTPDDLICSGVDVDLIVPSPIGPQRCPVRMIRKLSKAEAKAH